MTCRRLRLNSLCPPNSATSVSSSRTRSLAAISAWRRRVLRRSCKPALPMMKLCSLSQKLLRRRQLPFEPRHHARGTLRQSPPRHSFLRCPRPYRPICLRRTLSHGPAKTPRRCCRFHPIPGTLPWLRRGSRTSDCSGPRRCPSDPGPRAETAPRRGLRAPPASAALAIPEIPPRSPALPDEGEPSVWPTTRPELPRHQS